MRLSKRLVDQIVFHLTKSFGDINIYLFGSRVDDTKKGGDIDIALEIDIPKEEFRRKKAIFLASLIRIGFDMKIDLVQYNHNEALLYEEICNNSVRLG